MKGTLKTGMKTQFVPGWKVLWVKIRVILYIFRNCYQHTNNILLAVFTMKQLIDNYKMSHSAGVLNKMVKVNGRYFWRVASPGFPSKAYDTMLSLEISRLLTRKPKGMRAIFLAITSKCPLQCEHCLEWNRLNLPETYNDEELLTMIKKFQHYQTAQVYFSGGEPLLRHQSIINILKNSTPDTDFWIITSGLGLTISKANELKKEGLTGVLVSLDHHLANDHNRFRGYSAAYDQAMKAIYNANQAGLVTGLSFCTTKDYTSADNLESYMELARSLGVSFVQMLEPKATGHYSDQEVALSIEQVDLLENTFLKYNYLAHYSNYPIIDYPGYQQRRVGCFGAGNRFFYVDSSGYAHACPFCSGSDCKVSDHSLPDIVSQLSSKSCGSFQKSNF